MSSNRTGATLSWARPAATLPNAWELAVVACFLVDASCLVALFILVGTAAL
jgi:hypothetical protein